MDDHFINLLRLEFIADLPYEDKLKAQGLINRGADMPLLYYWYNFTHGCYNNLPQVVKERDIESAKLKYPDFSDDIDKWK